jgi:hypothetical protein
MIELTGYQIIERIYSGTRTLVERGIRLCDQKPVAIKVLRNEYPSFSEHVHSQSVHDRQKPEFARNPPNLQLGSLHQRANRLIEPRILTPSWPGVSKQAAQPLTILETLSTLTNATYSIHSSTHHTTSSTSINHALDFSTLLQISQIISSTIDLDELLQILTQTMLQNSGADRCVLMLCQDQQWQVRAMATGEHISLQTEPLENNPTVPVKLIEYVKNTLAAVVIDHLKTDLPVIDDYLEHH